MCNLFLDERVKHIIGYIIYQDSGEGCEGLIVPNIKPDFASSFFNSVFADLIHQQFVNIMTSEKNSSHFL